MSKQKSVKRKSKRAVKSKIIAVAAAIMATIGLSHYHKELKPFISTIADVAAEWITSTPPVAGDVLNISDGDTLVVAGEYGGIKVRLYGIDAPESAQKYGDKAKAALASMTEGKNVTLTVIDTDRYGRSVGIIEADGVNINQQMLILGHAWYYEPYCKKSFCKKWQLIAVQAKKEKVGLWKDKNPVPPWQYRNGER